MKHPSLSKVKSSDTKPEIVVRKFLFHNGFRYRKNFKTWPGSPDICLTKIKKAIFIHGCFWHRHKDCKLSYFPKSNQDQTTNCIILEFDIFKSSNILDLSSISTICIVESILLNSF